MPSYVHERVQLDNKPYDMCRAWDTPIFDHALQGLPIQVVGDVKMFQHMQREGAEIHHVLMHVKCPHMTHVKDPLLAER